MAANDQGRITNTCEEVIPHRDNRRRLFLGDGGWSEIHVAVAVDVVITVAAQNGAACGPANWFHFRNRRLTDPQVAFAELAAERPVLLLAATERITMRWSLHGPSSRRR
jgi:hypothetical protein